MAPPRRFPQPPAAAAAPQRGRRAAARSPLPSAGDDLDPSGIDDPHSPPDDSTGDIDGDDLPSKSQRKREMLALQKLGLLLCALPPERLAILNLPERLAEAIRAAGHTRTREGLRRHRQYIGRLMREEAIDAAAIQDQLDLNGRAHQQSVMLMHSAERWRDALLNGSQTLTAFIDEHPLAAQAGLARLVADSRRERARIDGLPLGQRPAPRQARRLYQALYLVLQGKDPATGMGADDIPDPDGDGEALPQDSGREDDAATAPPHP